MPEPRFVDHEVEVFLNVTTTHDDLDAALVRSGIVEGALSGEALILNAQVYSPALDHADPQGSAPPSSDRPAAGGGAHE